MRHLCKLSLALAAVIALSGSLQAQGPGGRGGGMFGGGLGLLTNKSVQTELKLTDEQASKVQSIVDDIRSKHRDDMEKVRDLQGQERMTRMQEIQRAMNDEAQKPLADVLKPEQLKRFQQIELQVRGINAFADPKVQSALNLTDDQKSKLQDIRENMTSQMREIFQSSQDDRQAAMRKMTDLRRETQQKAIAVLSDDQKKTWKDMTGEPFEVRFEPPGGGGRRGQ